MSACKTKFTATIVMVFCVCIGAGCANSTSVKKETHNEKKMITDKIDSAEMYYGLGRRIAQGLALLKDPEVLNAAKGRHDVDGDNLFFMADEYDSKPEAEGRLEAHHKYIDIQYVVSGREWIGCRGLEGLTLETPYSAEKDIEFYHSAEPMTRIDMEPGTFAIIWPHEAHMPGRMFDKPVCVKKIVVKVLAE